MTTTTYTPNFTPKNNQGSIDNNSHKERPIINPLNLNMIRNNNFVQPNRRESSRQGSLTHSGFSPSPSARSTTDQNQTANRVQRNFGGLSLDLIDSQLNSERDPLTIELQNDQFHERIVTLVQYQQKIIQGLISNRDQINRQDLFELQEKNKLLLEDYLPKLFAANEQKASQVQPVKQNVNTNTKLKHVQQQYLKVMQREELLNSKIDEQEKSIASQAIQVEELKNEIQLTRQKVVEAHDQKRQYQQLYNNERKRLGQSSHHEAEVEFSATRQQTPAPLEEQQDWRQLYKVESDLQTLKQEMHVNLDIQKNATQQNQTKRRLKGNLATAFEEERFHVVTAEEDTRVNDLHTNFKVAQSELCNEKSIRKHLEHQLRQTTLQTQDLQGQLQDLTSQNIELAKSNQRMQQEVSFVSKVNCELEQVKQVGLKHDECQEMIRQIGLYRASPEQACLVQKEQALQKMKMVQIEQRQKQNLNDYTRTVVSSVLLALVSWAFYVRISRVVGVEVI